jgi:hypothetical protein
MTKMLEILTIGVALLVAPVIAVGISAGVAAQNDTMSETGESKIGISSNLSGAQSSLEAVNNTNAVNYAENETGR